MGRTRFGAVKVALLFLSAGCGPQTGENGGTGVAQEELREVLDWTGASEVHTRRTSAGVPLTGAGIVFGAWEPGIPFAHPDFASRLTVVTDPDPGDRSGAPRDHATKVAGTLIGDGAGTATPVTGFAPAASVVAVELWGTTNNQLSVLKQLMTGTHPSGAPPIVAANFSNSSSSDAIDCTGAYTAESVVMDTMVRDTKGVVVRSAGNRGFPGHFAVWTPPPPPTAPIYGVYCADGWSTLNPEAVAKNVITVGATERGPGAHFAVTVCNAPGPMDSCPTTDTVMSWPYEPSPAGNWILQYSSSRGPTRDGRLKPDLVGRGNAVASVTASATGYEGFAQTSFAAPQVSGIAGLVLQKYNADIGPIPNASMVRAILLHTADDQGPIGPDYYYGWGAVNATAAIDLIDAEIANGGTRLAWTVLRAGTPLDYLFFVDERPSPAYGPSRPAGSPGVLRITAAWTDPPGTAGAARALVNDLDITLIDPSGQTIYPWLTPFQQSCQAGACDRSKIPLPAIRGVNSTDNVEQIVFALPAGVNGAFTLRVLNRGPSVLQNVAIAANHDVFLPPPSAEWEICGSLCTTSDQCCSLAELGNKVSCSATTGICTLASSLSRGTRLTLKVLGQSEAGLAITEGYNTLRPAGAADWAPVTLSYLTAVPQPLGTEVKSAAAGSTYRFSVAGKYRFSGRVRNRLSAYVLGTQPNPKTLEINVN